MYSPKEKEIIERCLIISMWNYRAGKSSIAGKEPEASVLRGKARQELKILERLIINLYCPTPSVEPKIKKIMRLREFLNRLTRGDLQ